MSDIFAALGTGVLVLFPVVILATIAAVAAGKRGESSGHH